jgi:transposase
VHSEAKETLERKAREQRIAKAEHALKEMAPKLNRYRLKTRKQVEKAIKKATQGASAYLRVTLHEEKTFEQVQIGCGRPGPDTRYEEKEVIHYRLEWKRDTEEIRKERRSDGLFPLVDNTAIEPTEVFYTYKAQPYLERRFYTVKSDLKVAPVFLNKPRRIEAMMFLYFVALMLVSLIERRIRLEMQIQNIESLPLRPAKMQTKKPTWRTIVDSFHGVHLASIQRSGKIIRTTVKGMSELRQHILVLLKVPISVYTRLRDKWWIFALE